MSCVRTYVKSPMIVSWYYIVQMLKHMHLERWAHWRVKMLNWHMAVMKWCSGWSGSTGLDKQCRGARPATMAADQTGWGGEIWGWRLGLERAWNWRAGAAAVPFHQVEVAFGRRWGRGAMWWGWDNHGRRDGRGAPLIGDAKGDLQSVVRAEQISVLWVDFQIL
jgi:hypothetical protein